MTDTRGRIVTVLLAILVVIASGAALRATYYVTMPLAAAFFAAVLVWPLHERLRRRLPEPIGWLSTVVTMVTVLGALAAFVTAGIFAVWQVTSNGGEGGMVGQFRQQWHEMAGWLRERGVPIPDDPDGDQMTDLAAGALGAVASSLVGAMTIAVLFIFYLLLMLVEAHHWQRKSRTVLSKPQARELMDAMGAVARQVRTFVLVQAFVAGITALVTVLWLWVVGMPFVLLWGLLTFVLDFVPNVGPIIAGILVTGVALVILGWQRALITGLGVLAIQQFFGNYIDPLLKGRRMSISPLVVLVAIVFWAWVWGPLGAILAVPLTATIIIACAHVSSLRSMALMLSRTAAVDELDETTRSD